MIDYSIPYSFKIEEKDDGTYEIIICAIGFKSPEHAQSFLKDMIGMKKQNYGMR